MAQLNLTTTQPFLQIKIFNRMIISLDYQRFEQNLTIWEVLEDLGFYLVGNTCILFVIVPCWESIKVALCWILNCNQIFVFLNQFIFLEFSHFLEPSLNFDFLLLQLCLITKFLGLGHIRYQPRIIIYPMMIWLFSSRYPWLCMYLWVIMVVINSRALIEDLS